MLQARYIRHDMIFRQAAGTSRGVLYTKESWFIILNDSATPEVIGIGECGLIPGLSPDPKHIYEAEIENLCQKIESYEEWITQSSEIFPSIRFGLETALFDLKNGGRRILFENEFSSGLKQIQINGLVWMGSADQMKKQLHEKLDLGYNCIKIKVGAIDFEEELVLVSSVRKAFTASQISIRLDANGAFSSSNVFEKLNRLAEFDIHSIEQPVKQGQMELMAEVCEKSPIPIALDEELIGVYGVNSRAKLMQIIKPQYIILKPSLLGGFQQSDEWIEIADQNDIGWWITSALESNIGLNAIAQWTAEKDTSMPQGLGTGQLFTNNFKSPLVIRNGQLAYDQKLNWNLEILFR